ncbi:MAG: TraB/VirB10 family protein [Neisseriaceae bacterium]|nr:TraB/VirB10 family protein [Neisseriaceae bacterium]
MAFSDKFKNMNGKQKQKAILGGLAAVIALLVIGGVINDVNKGTLKSKKAAQQTQVLNATQRNLTLEELANRIQALNMRFDQQEINNQQRLQEMFAGYQPPQQQMNISEDDIRRIIAEEKANDIASGITSDGDPFTDPANPQAPLAGVGGEYDDEEKKEVFKTLITNQDAQGLAEQKAKEAGKNYLPVGSTISFVSVAGMNAPTNAIATGASGSGDLMPTLLRIRGKAILPNKNEFNLQDCVVVAVGYGQMADERAILRTEKMSCIDSNGQTTEVALKGTVFGEDGKPGLRGRLVSKNGEVIAQMVKIGAIQTLGNMLVAAAGNYDFKNGRSTGNNNGVTVNTGNNGSSNMANAIAQQGASGINDTFQRIAGIYEQYAQQTFPVIEVNPGRKGEIVLTEGIAIDYKGQD